MKKRILILSLPLCLVLAAYIMGWRIARSEPTVDAGNMAQTNASFVRRIHPDHFPQPAYRATRTTLLADLDARVPIVLLVNRTGRSLTDYTQLVVDYESNLESYGKGTLLDGQQRLIVPYIREGGKVRLVYEIGGRRVRSWRSAGPLVPGVPMVLTVYANKVVVNKPYSREQF